MTDELRAALAAGPTPDRHRERTGHGPEWEAGTWGVIIGVSRCAICGQTCTSEDFTRPAIATRAALEGSPE